MFFFFFFHLFLLVGGWLLYNIVVHFVIHWHESAMDLHVSPVPIPPPISLSTQSLWVFPVHQARALVSCIQPGLAYPYVFFFFLKSTTFSFTRVDLSLYWCSFSRLQMFETKLSCFLFQMSSPVSLGETEFDSFIPEILSWKYLKGKDKMK